ncbi:alpha-N-acetylgalactosaminidase-like [Plodia interpunctella]|uniref:alpha-N-acetylgalactosaminidase-like n=1 Tax=Plodia interpunctella TaxID=58824 RepID=UPI002368F0E2|nr:alpha-N-acetylgalactosaminidase-like [Plodia interpunctella]
MLPLRGVCLLVFSILFPAKVTLLENGLARTPPMGWMSWGYYMCGDDCGRNPLKCLDEKLILSVVDSFFDEGYQEVGFEYIIIDDCWSEKSRDMYGRLVPNKERFPRGMKFIADYIHARGLKFGMYTNIADVTCMLYPGSKNFFDIDAKSFAEWGVDYLKVDGCFVQESYLDTAYIDLGRALNSTKRQMVYSCSWPYYLQYIHNRRPNYSPIAKHCNMWRNFHDVALDWKYVIAIIHNYIDEYPKINEYHGPGHWNDPDMLILGTRTLTPGQSRVQLAVYAMMSAPLLLSCDMKMITPEEKQLLQNTELIAIGQDPLGIMATPYRLSGVRIIYVKKHLPMKGDYYHSFSVAMVNLDQKPSKFTFTLADHGISAPDGYTVMNVFTKVYEKNVTSSDEFEIEVPPEDVTLYSLFPL